MILTSKVKQQKQNKIIDSGCDWYENYQPSKTRNGNGCGTCLHLFYSHSVLPDLYHLSLLRAICFVQADSAVFRYTTYHSILQEQLSSPYFAIWCTVRSDSTTFVILEVSFSHPIVVVLTMVVPFPLYRLFRISLGGCKLWRGQIMFLHVLLESRKSTVQSISPFRSNAFQQRCDARFDFYSDIHITHHGCRQLDNVLPW